MSVKVSRAPGCGCSRRTIARVPTGQRDRSTRSLISATSASSRCSLPSALIAGRQCLAGTCKHALRIGSVRSSPIEKRTHLGVTAGVDEAMRQRRRVGTSDDLDGRGVDRQLGQRHGEQFDMVRSRVRPGVARPQDPCQCFTGGVQEGEQRVMPEAAFVGRRRAKIDPRRLRASRFPPTPPAHGPWSRPLPVTVRVRRRR
jgi:hypothetical protein